jgi:hypothetical protein
MHLLKLKALRKAQVFVGDAEYARMRLKIGKLVFTTTGTSAIQRN